MAAVRRGVLAQHGAFRNHLVGSQSRPLSRPGTPGRRMASRPERPSAQAPTHSRRTPGWRIYWRIRRKDPANTNVLGGLENRYPSLGGSRVRIPPPPLNQAVPGLEPPRCGRVRSFRPQRSVHRSPASSLGVHWLQRSLAHSWRTSQTVCVLSTDNKISRSPPGSAATRCDRRPRQRLSRLDRPGRAEAAGRGDSGGVGLVIASATASSVLMPASTSSLTRLRMKTWSHGFGRQQPVGAHRAIGAGRRWRRGTRSSASSSHAHDSCRFMPTAAG